MNNIEHDIINWMITIYILKLITILLVYLIKTKIKL